MQTSDIKRLSIISVIGLLVISMTFIVPLPAKKQQVDEITLFAQALPKALQPYAKDIYEIGQLHKVDPKAAEIRRQELLKRLPEAYKKYSEKSNTQTLKTSQSG